MVVAEVSVLSRLSVEIGDAGMLEWREPRTMMILIIATNFATIRAIFARRRAHPAAKSKQLSSESVTRRLHHHTPASASLMVRIHRHNVHQTSSREEKHRANLLMRCSPYELPLPELVEWLFLR